MIQIQQVKVPVSQKTTKHLKKKAARELHIGEHEISEIVILKESIDARKKPDLYYVLNLGVKITGAEKDVLHKNKRNSKISIFEKIKYHPVCVGVKPLQDPPVIIGAGPAGLFAAYLLAKEGFCPIILERGADIVSRTADVSSFWKSGLLNPASNVQFGEGGAGAFSDGKLNTLVKDKFGRNRFVLETFVSFGAPESILYENKPHIGTDRLFHVVQNMRNEIIRLGGSVSFSSCVTDFIYQDNEIKQLVINQQELLSASVVILAIGHSARDTFVKLHEQDIAMTAKEFAVGFRVEHPQTKINESQYGVAKPEHLSAAPYKLTANLENGRGIYSFCMCPGGYVVNASSHLKQCAVNGMSYFRRDSKNANSAIIVSVGAREYDMADPLSGMKYQQNIEAKAYEIGQGKLPQQLYGDFLDHKTSVSYGSFTSEAKGAVTFGNLRDIFSEDINDSFIQGMEQFGKKISGFNSRETILSGVESRTSSPIRILRDETLQSNRKGLYPCGEGAGYAGGIMSAAMDGLKVAEEILKCYKRG